MSCWLVSWADDIVVVQPSHIGKALFVVGYLMDDCFYNYIIVNLVCVVVMGDLTHSLLQT